MSLQNATFWGWEPRGPMTLKFELGLNFLTVHLPTKFHHPMFNPLEVIVLTNKQTQLDAAKTSIFASLCCAGGE